MFNLSRVIVSMACIHQLTSHLLFKNKQHQLPLKTPVKTSSKAWLVHTAPLNQSQMSPRKLFLSFPHSTPFSNLSFPFSSLHIPFPVRDCVDGWSSAVVIWHSSAICLFLSPSVSSFPSTSLPFPFSVLKISILSSRHRPTVNLHGVHDHSRWKIRPTWLMSPKKCASQNAFQLICWAIWCHGDFEIHATACLSK